MAQVPVGRIVLFDRDPVQLQFGALIVELVRICPSRERFVVALFGRSMEAWGRLLGPSSMLDFLELPIDSAALSAVASELPEELRELYATVCDCLARREGWPLVWPSFGRSGKLPLRGLPNSQRRLGGGRNEAMHINEVGWLRDERSYSRVREALLAAPPELRELDLAHLGGLQPGSRHVVFISNIDTARQFLDGEELERLRAQLRGECSAEGGVLLLSTARAEWLSPES